MDVTNTLICTVYDGGSFDWRDWLNLEFLDDLSTGNGNGNTGDGINCQGNGFGNSGTDAKGTRNGNGNSDWQSDQFEVAVAVFEQHLTNAAENAAADWSWERTREDKKTTSKP